MRAEDQKEGCAANDEVDRGHVQTPGQLDMTPPRFRRRRRGKEMNAKVWREKSLLERNGDIGDEMEHSVGGSSSMGDSKEQLHDTDRVESGTERSEEGIVKQLPLAGSMASFVCFGPTSRSTTRSGVSKVVISGAARPQQGLTIGVEYQARHGVSTPAAGEENKQPKLRSRDFPWFDLPRFLICPRLSLIEGS